jgi:hypothetical protein
MVRPHDRFGPHRCLAARNEDIQKMNDGELDRMVLHCRLERMTFVGEFVTLTRHENRIRGSSNGVTSTPNRRC